jgi:hypothetical protein
VKAAKGGWPSGQAPVSAGLLQFTLMREAEIARELAGGSGIKALIDRPLLTIASHRVIKADPVKGEIVTKRALDIVENGIRYVTPAGRPPKVAFDAALRQAVGDSVLEQRIVEAGASTAAAESGANFFRKAELEHRPIVWAAAADTQTLRNAGVGDDDIAWIRSNEPASAHLLVTSTAEGEVAWWSVRQDGNGILRVRGGHGQASEEEMLVTEIVDIAMLAVCGFEVGKAVGHGVLIASRRGVASDKEKGETAWAVLNAVKCLFLMWAGAAVVGEDYLAYQVSLAWDVGTFLGSVAIEQLAFGGE